MNGRTYPTATTAVDRTSGPVLAWNVEPTQFPAGTYPEMPAAAAAAVSPVVPAAAAATAPPDPYGRCWQNQVDPSACFPYFGTLYGSSLPPPSYRMQPGCLSNLGQFWPPTPPPEGCLRYDGTNNLHYCSPLTPVFRHGESLPQNMLGVHQRLGHYSHLIDINKDASLKRIDCLDGIQRQKMLLASKHSKEVQQRICSCYECNEKNFSRGATPSVNKENISSGKLLEQKFSEDKLKSKSCKKAKDENFSNLRNSAAYHPTVSAIHNYACPMEQNVARTPVSMQGPNQSDFLVQNSQKVENTISNGNCVQHEFLRPESNSFPISRCAANSIITSAPSKDVTHIVQSTAKTAEQTRYDNLAEKMSRHKLQVSTPGYESCACPQEQASSSSSRRSTEKSCCFSPPHVSSRTLYHNYPENTSHNKTPNMLLMYGNGYNASPLKNVYFSYYESENFDMGSGATSRKSKGNVCKMEKTSNMSSEDNHVQIPSTSQGSYVLSSGNSGNSGLNGNFPCRSQYDSSTVPSESYGCMYQSSCIEQQKSSNSSYLGSSNIKRNDVPLFAEQMAKIHSVHIKQEKGENMDCKYQKSHHGSNSGRNAKIAQLPDAITSNGVLNLSTSMRCPKIEPDDQMNPTSTDPMRTSFSAPVSCSLANVSAKSVETCSQILKTDDMSSGYYSGIPVSGHMMKCHKVPDATTPQMHELESDCTPAVPEDLCPITQMAPSGGAESAVLSKMPTTGYEAPVEVSCQSNDLKESCEHSTSRNDCNGSNSELHHLARQESSHSSSEHMQSSVFRKRCSSTEIKVDDHQPTPVSTEKNIDCCISQFSHAENSSKLASASTLSCYTSCTQPQSQNDSSTEANNCEIIAEKKIILPSIKTEVEEKSCSEQTEADLPVLSEERISPESELMSEESPAKSENVKSEDSCVKKEPVDCETVEHQESGSEKYESSPVEDCHGLYVLLQGIAHKDNVDSPLSSSEKQTGDQTDNCSDKSSLASSHDASHSPTLKMKGLNLLCALAEEQFFVEFGDGVNLKRDLSANLSPVVKLSSNYPEVKDDIVTSTPLSNEESDRKADTIDGLSTELKMRKRLAELQQKYKEKQRELARLKPKKVKSPANLETCQLSSSASDISCVSLNCCHSANCSKGTSPCEGSVEKSCRLADAQSLNSELVLQEDASPILAKSQKISTRYSSKFSPDESCSGGSATNSDTKVDLKATAPERNSLRNRSKPVSRCMERLSVARRRLELRRNLRSNVSTRHVSTSAKVKNSTCTSTRNSIPQTESSDVSDGVKILAKRHKKFSKRKVVRSSEKSSPESSKAKGGSSEEAETFSAHASRSPKKRKPENPKRFMPAKQVRLTETIVAKQLRNRILFESPECKPKKSDEKSYDVPEELFDALRKCHLGEGSQSCENKQPDTVQALESQDLKPVKEKACSNVQERALKMATEYLIEDQRILAIDEGLFYAGCIKEVQSPDVYSIVLDGQRGNKKHLFSLEEMLTQTILESKPSCLDELPEGTRVCAYWSHQYRCLYPGTVVRAPAPSPDWSEPRVFVEFDDGDSAQIAMKNIRFLPADLKISDEDMKDGLPEVPPFEFKDGVSECKGFGQRKRKRPRKDIGNHSKLNKADFSNGKINTSCCSNESNTEEYCGQEPTTESPSQRLDEEQLQDRQLRGNAMDTKISRRTQKQLAKRLGNKNKVKENNIQAEKSKKHKRYKDRHKHHHHHRHHHRHRRHCHHHRHCKKRKHHKRASNVDNIINVVIPSNSIPFSNLIAKSTRSSMKDAEAQCVGHSKKEGKQLPQPTGEMGDSKSVGTSIAKGTSKKESTALSR